MANRDDGTSYAQIVRWNGPLNNFTILKSFDGKAAGLTDGGTIKATITTANGSNAISLYVNGILIVQAKDRTYHTGSPGMGFFLQGATGVNSDYGFTRYMQQMGHDFSLQKYTI